MITSSQHAGRRRHIIAAATSVVLTLVGGVVVLLGMDGSSGPPQPPVDAGRSMSAAASPTHAGAAAPKTGSSIPSPSAAVNRAKDMDLEPILRTSPPIALEIPSIGVRTTNFVSLGRAADGSLQVPQDFSSVGWYAAGPSPGQLGPAIMAGHVDGPDGPAIFYRLGALRPQARIAVGRKDGSTATFIVDRIQRFPKDQFPTARVYGSTNRAELRLITCGGSFDQKSGHYIDNIVAFAHLVE
jgi:Sortase domain